MKKIIDLTTRKMYSEPMQKKPNVGKPTQTTWGDMADRFKKKIILQAASDSNSLQALQMIIWNWDTSSDALYLAEVILEWHKKELEGIKRKAHQSGYAAGRVQRKI